MKKLMIILGAVGVLTFATSCKKCYTCSVGGSSSGEYCDDVYNASQIDALKTSCEGGGGTWSAK